MFYNNWYAQKLDAEYRRDHLRRAEQRRNERVFQQELSKSRQARVNAILSKLVNLWSARKSAEDSVEVRQLQPQKS